MEKKRMNKKILVACGLLVAGYSMMASAVSDNTISFQGEVTDETCSLTVNGNETSPIILLPTVSTSDLATSGSFAGATTFEMGVSGCTGTSGDDAAETAISTVFSGNLVETVNGTLGNTGTAENVTVQILDTAGTAINLSSTYTAEGDLTLAAGDTASTATYTAQYYATDVAAAGTVAASMQYAISYQ
ncbi:fimbrial protein [Rahnella sp. PCH160]|uniref:fimbrial protein n=1 Tax=Rahnella sp. PCH160 TaxID=3447928 RepID=UPI0039FC1B29